MALKGLKKADQSSNQDQIEDFIKGAELTFLTFGTIII